MSGHLFPIQLQSALSEAESLAQVSQILCEQAARVAQMGRRIGFVVGKITPSEGETLSGNKQLLLRRTIAIAQIVFESGTDVFSSATVPDILEGRFPPEDFYEVFDGFVRKHVRVLYTTEGWEQSWGANNEVSIAREQRLEIFHYKNGNLVKEN
jgi:hypothetical protein